MAPGVSLGIRHQTSALKAIHPTPNPFQVISGIPLNGCPPPEEPVLTRGRTLPPAPAVPVHNVEDEAEEEEAEAAVAEGEIAEADAEADVQIQAQEE